jgi:hypothetical protein
VAKAEATVEELVGMIQRGELRLPEMQRRYVWRSTRVRDLLDSLYRGYPSGAILLWDADEKVPLQEFGVAQDLNPFASTKLLLDGQQRLTSLSAVIRGLPVSVRGRVRPIELLFNLEHPETLSVVTEVHEESDADVIEDEVDSSADELQSRLNKMTFVVATRKLAALPQWVKVSEVFKSEEDAPFLKRAGIERVDDPRYTMYSQRLARLRRIRKYSYRMDVLERTLTYDEVTEIFVRVNSLGAKLRSSDLALAQITAKWRGALEIFQAFERSCASIGFELDLGVHLRNMIAFATGQSRFLTIGGLPIEQIQEAWVDARRGMEFAINYMKSNVGIDSPVLLSSPSLMISLAYFGHKRRYEIIPAESQRMRYWILVANAKGRYSRGSSETLLDQDLATLRDGGGPDELIDRLRTQVGRLDITAEELQGRNQRSALFKTMFVAFQQGGAKDWVSNLAISLDHSGAQHKLQFHHIFPKALLKGRPPRETDDIANFAFIAGKTNRGISDKPPIEYIPKLEANVGAGAFEAQCIPMDDALHEIAAYDRFLVARRDLIANRLNAFLGTETGGRSEGRLSAQLLDLDERIEAVELDLRKLITERVEDVSLIPHHVASKLRERMEEAHRKSPASVNLGSIEPTDLLVFADLRELQDVITAKSLWTRFDSTFGTKEVLNTQIGYIADLRNTIRHSRPVDEVTRKHGDAALMWIRQQLQAI